jgi:ATP-dependent Clp protease protease subunit
MVDVVQPSPDKTRAEIAKLEAETACARNESKLKAAEARKAVAEAEQAEIVLAEKRDAEQTRKAGDRFHRVYGFTDPVKADTVEACIRQLSTWSRNNPGCDMEIIFNSPGGSVMAGMHLFDHIQVLKAQGHNITTTALGMAASMAGILLQAGTTRVMGAEAYLLIHEVASGAIGKIGEIEDEMVLLKKMTERVARIFASRSKLTAAQIKHRMRRTDWWLDADESLKLGLIDEIRGL